MSIIRKQAQCRSTRRLLTHRAVGRQAVQSISCCVSMVRLKARETR